jgi:hypothetical protein
VVELVGRIHCNLELYTLNYFICNILLSQVYAAVSHLVESPLCMEAVSVLEAVLQSSSNGSVHSETHPTGNFQENGAVNNVPRSYRRTEDSAPSPQRVLVPQNSFKLRNSGQQPWTGPGGPVPSGAVSPVAADILPSRSEGTVYFSFIFSSFFDKPFLGYSFMKSCSSIDCGVFKFRAWFSKL